MISPICTEQVFHLYLARLMPGARWNVEGALFSPKSMRVHSWSLSWDENSVFSLSFSKRGACQNPLRGIESSNIRASHDFSVLSATLGTG